MQSIPPAILRRLQARIPPGRTDSFIYEAGILKCGEINYIRRYCFKHNYIVHRVSPGRFRISPSPVPLISKTNPYIAPCR